MRKDDAYNETLDLLQQREMALPVHKRHRLPESHYALTGSEYFFTICARHRGEVFRDPTLANAVIDALRWQIDHRHWRLFGYCLMPTHLHFVSLLEEDESRTERTILDDVGAFKSFTTTQCWWRQGGRGKLWQRSSYDKVIRYNDSIDEAMIYMLNNPVRKGYVETWDQYPYSAIVEEW